MSDQRDLAHGGGLGVSLGPVPNPDNPFAPLAPLTGLVVWWGSDFAEVKLTPDEVDWLIAELEARKPKK